MYSVLSYGQMAADGLRMDAYARAIARLVTPSSVVLDLGAGTGIFSLLALRAGARLVHAVDPNPAVLLVADLARENGFRDRVTVHLGSSLDLTLPESERADLVVSDIRGSTGLNGDNLAILRDARARHLRPGGVVLPAKERLHVALADAASLEQEFERARVGFVRRGFSIGAIDRSLRNTIQTASLAASDLVSTAERWAEIDFAATEPPGLVQGTVELRVTRDGVASALVVWFDTVVHEDLGYSTAPGNTTVYSRLLLPLEEIVDVHAGEAVKVTLRADERGSRWAWDSTFAGAAPRAMRQATFLGTPGSKEAFLQGSSSHRPTLTPSGSRAARALAACDGTKTVAEIAELVARAGDGKDGAGKVPDGGALEEVRDLVARYGR